MAKAFPECRIHWLRLSLPFHRRGAGARASEANVRNARFRSRDAVSYAERDFDFIAFFDCLHDMADPRGAARHAHQALKADGNCMIVEPFAGDKVEDNLNPIGRALLRRVLASLCASIAGSKWSGARRASRRKQITRGRNVSRLLALPPCYRDAVQHGPRSAPLTFVSNAATVARHPFLYERRTAGTSAIGTKLTIWDVRSSSAIR